MRIKEPRELREPKDANQRSSGWEYRTEVMDRQADLDQFATEDWELVAVIPAAADQAVFYFKRRR